MIKDPQVNDKVECRLHPESPWREGRVESRYEDSEGNLWCVVELDSGAHTNFLAASASIRRPLLETALGDEDPLAHKHATDFADNAARAAAAPPEPPKKPEKRKGPSVRVWVRVRAEVEFELPSPWNGEETHNDLVPIAMREGREHLQRHLPKNTTIHNIVEVETRVVSGTERKS